MSQLNKHQIEYEYYAVRLGSKQTAQLKYLSQILQSKSLRYTLETVIESAFVNCVAYQEGEEDYEDENEEGA